MNMSQADAYRAAADLVLITHVTFVAFVVFGLFLIFLGRFCGWSWIRNPWFRILHMAGIGLVVVQTWLGVLCPLTALEMHLREKAGEATYAGDFIAHWFQKLLYYDAPPWVFNASYTVFGLAVIGSWIWVRPRSILKNKRAGSLGCP